MRYTRPRCESRKRRINAPKQRRGSFSTHCDRQVKAAADNKTIGIILCKTKNKVTAEYALSNIHNPMGVATYQTTEALPEDLQDKLPALSELAARLEEVPEESEAQAK
jgi:YhcG PDDEXK nuclease domain